MSLEIRHPSAAAAADEIERRFRVAGRDWYAFGDGELARVNARLARGEPAPVSPVLAALLSRAMRLHVDSGGLFDPSVCALVRLWGFDSEASLGAAREPPADEAIRPLLGEKGHALELRIDAGMASSARPLCIDLGGMAKGTALELARSVLEERGITDAFVDIGGSSQLALGQKGSRRWAIGLRHPRTGRVAGRLSLEPGEAVSTSGDYERAWVANGQRYHHVLDPATGKPTSASASVTVLAGDAELADAASTALMVAGPTRFSEICGRLGIKAALLVTSNGELLATPAMARRLERDNGGALPALGWNTAAPGAGDPVL